MGIICHLGTLDICEQSVIGILKNWFISVMERVFF